MKRLFSAILLFYASFTCMMAQFDNGRGISANDSENRWAQDNSLYKEKADTIGHKNDEIPIGMHVWTVDRQFGDVIPATPDTLPHTYRNTLFTNGSQGEYNTTGNQGSPRIARIFTDRTFHEPFIFIQPFDYFVTPVENYHFTNTFSPITNLSYNSCGNKTNGEDHLRALFATNVNKQLGFGFKFDYLYARGYYQNQSTSHFGFTFHTSYLGDRYDMHLLFSTNHQKIAENGGITDDNYITHPESFTSFNINEIPVVLSNTWNHHDNHHIFLTHRYKVGFKKKESMTEDEIKARKFAIESEKKNEQAKRDEKERKTGKKEDEKFSGRPDNAKVLGDLPEAEKKEDSRTKVNSKDIADSLHTTAAKDSAWTKEVFVPVTSFIHTLEWNYFSRIFESHAVDNGYYLNQYYNKYHFLGDSIYDDTKHYSIRNTLAIALLEGFNKYAKAGLKVFTSYEMRNYTLPNPDSISFDRTQSYKENNLSIGAQLIKSQGSLLHYTLTAETWLTGEDAGQFRLQGKGDLNFRLFKDTIRLEAKAAIEHNNPNFYFRHYHSKHYWWDNNLDKEIRTKIEGTFSLKRTRTRLRVAYDNLNNYTYFWQKYDILPEWDYMRQNNTVEVRQSSKNISILTAQLSQDLTLGPLNWENTITYQTSSDEDIVAVPALNIFSNLYFKFWVAKVLDIHLGADVRYFTKYYAPDYSPALGQYTVQGNDEKIKIGNYPWINIYADFFLKHARFFVMYTHANKGGSKQYFMTPHYPTNGSLLRLGVSWNFFN